MKKELGFFETLRISAFDFKSYGKFIDMPFLKVTLNRVLFVFLISLFYVLFLNRDIKILNDFNKSKYEIFEDISYSNGTLHIQNSPVMFKSGDFLLIGDTREEFNINEFSEYDNYKTSVVLLKNSFIFKNNLREFEIKYSDFSMIDLVVKDSVFNKDIIFMFIDSITNTFKYLVYVILPLFMIFNFFFLAFLTSFFAFFCSIITRFRVKFSQVYKMILFAQGIPFLIISIFEIIAKFNNVSVLFPSHILEFLTLTVFLISIFSIKNDKIKKSLNNRR